MENQENREAAGAQEEIIKKLPVIIKLKKPIATEDGVVEELKITREPQAGDWFGFNIQAPDVLSFMKVASNLTGVALPYLKKLCTSDMLKVQEKVADFLASD